MASSEQLLRIQYPWTSIPLIVSAPMRLISGPELALSVSLASGLGFIGAGTDLSNFKETLSACARSVELNHLTNAVSGTIPIGVGFICWGASLAVAKSVISGSPAKPAATWLFAPRELEDLIPWSQGIREASEGKTKIWVQVGTVAMAVEVAKLCNPDVLVIQGSDAGGHGLVRSSSVITLLPDCADSLKKEGFGHIPLVAAGGIVDGRGAAAVITLGASGVCMGTRFLIAPEAILSDGYRDAIISAKDGGTGTARTSLYDRLRGTSGWPKAYNARGILNQSFWDHENGLTEEENTKLYEEAVKMGNAGWGEQGRMATYAGTGVGLIKASKPAGEIVKEISRDTKECLAEAIRRFQ